MSDNGAAKIYDMEYARARRAAGEAFGAGFAHAGEQLRHTREARGLSLVEAAATTHIRDRHLEAIEAMELVSLPPRPYTIGFVRAYAEFLELDADALVRRFKTDAGYGAAEKVEARKFEPKAEARAPEQRELSLIAVLAAILFIVWCVWQITLPREVKRLNPPAATPASPLPEPTAPGSALAPAPAETAPVLIDTIEPVYPRGCLNVAGPSETVDVVFNVSSSGRVTAERVSVASDPCFEDAALNALRRWRYRPRRVDGAPRPAYDLTHRFTFERPR